MAQIIEEYREIYNLLQRYVNENPDFYVLYDVLEPTHSFNQSEDKMLVLRVYKWPHGDKENEGEAK